VKSPHLLYVAWGYPPSRGAGMYRALATANAFAREGWRVTVLTATRETFERITGSDPATEKSIDASITVVRIPFDDERGETDLSRWSRWRVFSPILWTYLRGLAARASFPEAGYGAWRRPLLDAARQIHAADPVSLVIGTANPSVDFVPGDDLYRSHGIPYVLDHRDAWNLDVYTGRRLASDRSRSGRLEKRMLAQAAEAWWVNQPIRDWHAAEYPERAGDYYVVSNGYDPAFLDPTHPRRADPKRLVFGYLGTIYGPMPLREALNGWHLAREQSDLVRNAHLVIRGRLGHFAEPDPVAAALIAEYAKDGVSYGGPVSKTKVADTYREFDALLLLVSKSRYITSGKVFEYAATGLPIAAIHDPETAATSVLTGHPWRFSVADLSPQTVADSLIATAERAATLTSKELSEAQKWAVPLARDNQLLPRIAALRAIVEGGTRGQ
jgi:glycosyltransferase involved in cell wall biosynthesis